ncbi:MAG: Clp1/GlmU family protein [Acidimicrobiia bacterium]
MSAEMPYRALRERVTDVSGVVMVIGGTDTGKTSLLRMLMEDGLAEGRSVAYIDGDVASATVGPAACIGLKYVTQPEDLDTLSEPDELRFVGSVEPQGVVLPHVVAVASLVDLAKEESDLILLDTSSVVTGVVGQTLKYHMSELTKPSLVVAIGHGQELAPVVAMLRRFLSVRVSEVEPVVGLVPMSPVERQQERAASFHKEIGSDPQRWRVQTTVFAPTLPIGFDVSRLDGMLVGVQDERGRCMGLGVLEHDDGTVRVATRHGEEMRGLRLGSIRVELETFATSRVRLRELIFGV